VAFRIGTGTIASDKSLLRGHRESLAESPRGVPAARQVASDGGTTCVRREFPPRNSAVGGSARRSPERRFRGARSIAAPATESHECADRAGRPIGGRPGTAFLESNAETGFMQSLLVVGLFARRPRWQSFG